MSLWNHNHEDFKCFTIKWRILLKNKSSRIRYGYDWIRIDPKYPDLNTVYRSISLSFQSPNVLLFQNNNGLKVLCMTIQNAKTTWNFKLSRAFSDWIQVLQWIKALLLMLILILILLQPWVVMVVEVVHHLNIDLYFKQHVNRYKYCLRSNHSKHWFAINTRYLLVNC